MIRKIPKKSLIKPENYVVKLDPHDLRGSIILPKVKYVVNVEYEASEVFNGMILPIPQVLLYYLNPVELKIVATILEDTANGEYSTATIKQLAKRLVTSTVTISAAIYSLRRAGLLKEKPSGIRGNGRMRMLNYEAIQHLNDLAEGEDPAVFVRIRRASKRVNILNMTKEDIEMSYDNYALAPDHDPEEEEEYD